MLDVLPGWSHGTRNGGLFSLSSSCANFAGRLVGNKLTHQVGLPILNVSVFILFNLVFEAHYADLEYSVERTIS